MRIEELSKARRRHEEWAPFMAGLERRLRAERRSRYADWAAAAALFAVFVGLVALLPVRVERPLPLHAEVPTTSAPAFTPDEGVVFQTDGVVLVLSAEELS